MIFFLIISFNEIHFKNNFILYFEIGKIIHYQLTFLINTKLIVFACIRVEKL